MEFKRIKLDTLKNTRDLGGIKTNDGRILRKGLLIRSGQLAGASEKDIKTLQNEYNLSCVIDLRTEAEVFESPEKLPENISYYNFPLLDDSFLGIARDEFSMKSWLNVFADSDAEPEDVFSDMYDKLMFGERTEKYIRQFIKILIENEKGSVLWHCSAGKDRVGIFTVVLMLSLGVSRNVIMCDYLETNRFLKKDLIKAKIFAPFILRNKKQRDCFYVLIGVKEKYLERIFEKIDTGYGGTDKFLEEKFGIDKEIRELLINKYTEKNPGQ